MNNCKVRFACNIDTYYYPTVGTTITECFSETLDSGTIVLAHIPQKDRLFLKPYQYVKVYFDSDKIEDKLFLVDNFTENEENIEKHIYGYTIALMSETKMLEKIQCPNLSITHDLDENGSVKKITILEAINRYMELYVPKAKILSKDGYNWEYNPIIAGIERTKEQLEKEISDLRTLVWKKFEEEGASGYETEVTFNGTPDDFNVDYITGVSVDSDVKNLKLFYKSYDESAKTVTCTLQSIKAAESLTYTINYETVVDGDKIYEITTAYIQDLSYLNWEKFEEESISGYKALYILFDVDETLQNGKAEKFVFKPEELSSSDFKTVNKWNDFSEYDTKFNFTLTVPNVAVDSTEKIYEVNDITIQDLSYLNWEKFEEESISGYKALYIVYNVGTSLMVDNITSVAFVPESEYLPSTNFKTINKSNNFSDYDTSFCCTLKTTSKTSRKAVSSLKSSDWALQKDGNKQILLSFDELSGITEEELNNATISFTHNYDDGGLLNYISCVKRILIDEIPYCLINLDIPSMNNVLVFDIQYLGTTDPTTIQDDTELEIDINGWTGEYVKKYVTKTFNKTIESLQSSDWKAQSDGSKTISINFNDSDITENNLANATKSFTPLYDNNGLVKYLKCTNVSLEDDEITCDLNLNIPAMNNVLVFEIQYFGEEIAQETSGLNVDIYGWTGEYEQVAVAKTYTNTIADIRSLDWTYDEEEREDYWAFYYDESAPSDLEISKITSTSFSSSVENLSLSVSSQTTSALNIKLVHSAYLPANCYVNRTIIGDDGKKFNVPCADLNFNSYTLRQVLTALMQQVGCIPVVKNRKLTYLDYSEAQTQFGGGDKTVNNTVNRIQKTLSSDSYVTNLVNMSSSVLDTSNKVISEQIGFRDRNNVLIKQTSNLNLETKLPIFKVNSFKLRLLSSGFFLNPSQYQKKRYSESGAYYGGVEDSVTGSYDVINIFKDPSNSHLLGIKVNGAIVSLPTQHGNVKAITYQFQDIEIRCGKVEYNNGFKAFNQKYLIKKSSISSFTKDAFEIQSSSYTDLATITYSDGTRISNTKDSFFATYLKQKSPNSYYDSYIGLNFGDDFDFSDCNYFWIKGYIIPWEIEIATDNSASLVKEIEDSEEYENIISVNKTSGTLLCENYNVMATTLVVKTFIEMKSILLENSARQLTDQNYKHMNKDVEKFSDLAQFYYSTIGYSIGSTTISGLSTSFSELKTSALKIFSWDFTQTIFENIIGFIKALDILKTEDADLVSFDYISSLPKGWNENDIVTTNVKIRFPYTYLSQYSFDIEYQPLNSFAMTYTKKIEDVPFALEQYDSNDSGVTDFDRMSIHEQENVDRVGNETVNIAQRTTDFDDVQPLNSYIVDTVGENVLIGNPSEDIKYTVFQRTISVGNYCFNIQYTASKDAVLKNYFTSIKTKYRAYQYVDYSSSVLRKERDVIYAFISENHYGFDGDEKIIAKYDESVTPHNVAFNSTLLLTGAAQSVDFDPIKYIFETDSTQTCKNDISLISNNNSFAIIYEQYDNVSAGTYMLTGDPELDEKTGIVQEWQIWDDTFGESHKVEYISMLESDWNIYEDDEFKNASYKLPIISSEMSYTTVFSVVTPNNKGKRVFYKDNAERLNHTVQFIYYTDSNNVIWSENFIANNGLYQRDYQPNCVVAMSSFALDKDEHDEDIANVISDNLEDYVTVSEGKITVNFGNYDMIKLCYRDSDNKYKDYIGFKKSDASTRTFYMTLNDTKSIYVMDDLDGILYPRYTVGDGRRIKEK